MILVELAQFVDTHCIAKPQSDHCVDVLVEKCHYQSYSYLVGLQTQLLLVDRLFHSAVINQRECYYEVCTVDFFIRTN